MRPWHQILGGVLALLLAAGCGGGSSASKVVGSGGGAASGPTGNFEVVRTEPAHNSQPSAVSVIRVVFNRDVDPGTAIFDPNNIGITTVLVAEQLPSASQATVFPGTLAAQGTEIVFTPSAALVANALYAIALTSGVHDLGGLPLVTGAASGPLTLNVPDLVVQATFQYTPSGGSGTGGSTVAQIDVDTNRDGTITSADQSGKNSFATTGGAVFYYNVDDDDNNNALDSRDTTTSGNDVNDLAPIIVRRSASLPGSASVTISVAPAAAQSRIQIFKKSGSSWSSVYSSGASFTLLAADVAAADVQLGIEARSRVSSSWAGDVTLTLRIADGATTLGTDSVRLQCAPLLFCANTWPLEKISVVDIPSGWDATTPLKNAAQSAASAVGATLQVASGASYYDDRWIQDGHETGAVYLPVAGAARRRVDAVLQMARYRDIDEWCKDVLWGPDFGFLEEFGTTQSSLNSGGNFEVIPPYSSYPWGRFVSGGGTGTLLGTSTQVTDHMDSAYRDFLNASHWQAPALEVSSEWLAVGHIDEFMFFVPAPAKSRGWVLALASPTLAKTLLQNVANSGGGSKTVFAGRTGNTAYQVPSYQTTVNGILNNTALMTFNSQAQVRIDAIRAGLVQQLGLASDEIVELPVLYEDSGGTHYAVAYSPGVVNLVPVNGSSGTIHLLVPDPEGPDNPTDVWQNDIRPKLQALGTTQRPVQVDFVDCFNSYHVFMGEAHCGVNFVRTPPAIDWWDK